MNALQRSRASDPEGRGPKLTMRLRSAKARYPSNTPWRVAPDVCWHQLIKAAFSNGVRSHEGLNTSGNFRPTPKGFKVAKYQCFQRQAELRKQGLDFLLALASNSVHYKKIGWFPAEGNDVKAIKREMNLPQRLWDPLAIGPSTFRKRALNFVDTDDETLRS